MPCIDSAFAAVFQSYWARESFFFIFYFYEFNLKFSLHLFPPWKFINELLGIPFLYLAI